MTAPFSRLQLAAALLEYDNDPDNPDAPYRSAHESALFSHLRRNLRPPATTRKSSNYVGVALPSETASVGGRESILDGRRSRGSTFALRNPFGGEDEFLEEEDDEQQPQQMDLDLTSWGLDGFISEDKDKDKGKGKSKATDQQPLSSVNSHFPVHANAPYGSIPQRRPARSMSVGNYDHLTLAADDRRKSIASPLDLEDLRSTSEQVPFQRRRAASYTLDDSLQPPSGPPAVESIPFPSRSIRSPSPAPNDAVRPQRYSSASMDSKFALGEPIRPRTNSNGTMASGMLLDNDNPFALQPPSRASRFDPKAAAHARTISNASMGSRVMLDNDATSVMTGRPAPQGRPFSTIDLLRPKVLVMPSPLQSLRPSAPHQEPVREGFQVSDDGPPLPPGARAGHDHRRVGEVPIASNSFIPNPRDNLTLSQMTFRNTLKVDGPGATVVDLELPRATEEGQQMIFDPIIPEDMPSPYPADEGAQPGRPPGRLFGKSLIDDLESRKAMMRSKQRVFKGDDRPSMMARGLQRTSTLIDPSSLNVRPQTQRMSSYGSSPTRPTSAGPGPLLNFENDPKVDSKMLSPGARAAGARSVFGVDTLWEREMVKLKEIEAQERAEAEERERREALQPSKDKKKGKKRGDAGDLSPSPSSELHGSTSNLSTPSPHIPSSAPVLPVPTPFVRGPPPPVLDDDGSESDDSDAAPRPPMKKKEQAAGWHSDSSEEDGPRKTTGVGLRDPKKAMALLSKSRAHAEEEDSEDDIPLAANINRAAQRSRYLQPQGADSDSEEDQPLSVLMRKSSQQTHGLGIPQFDFDKGGMDDEDDDEKPLGYRASHVAPSFVGGDDDDRPLAMHPDQQRRSQMVFAQQQQQQQMMMQAQQMQMQSMFFNPSMMGSTFFNPAVAGPMPMMPTGPPMQIPSPPPLPDPTKFNRVDNWRHEVAIEGE